MSGQAHIAVIDVGKTNAKLTAVDRATGAETAMRTMPNDVRRAGPYPHFDVEALFAFFMDGLADFAADRGFDAISITAHGASAALLGDDGLALPVLDYEHDGPDALADEYDRLRPPFVETRSPRLPLGLNVGAQLFYQQRRFPDAFSRVRRIVTYPQYWGWRLTGIAATEVTSLGCHTDLWNPAAGTFSTLVDRLGVRPLMAPVRSAFDVLGPVKSGLARPVPVHTGLHDSNASLLPHLMARPSPFAVVSTGTWIILFGVGGDPSRLDPARDTLANVDAHGRPVPSARFMGGREFDLLTEGRPETPDAGTVARIVENDIMALPSFVGPCGPFPGGRGHWTVDPATLSAAERTAVASLYTALMTSECLELAAPSGPVVIEGPFARNALFAAALKAVTGRPVESASGSTGTSAGAALLAGGLPAAQPAVAATEDILPAGFAEYARRWRILAG
ncbi:FGGY-family carbohydrate kinase [Inquilinus sp. CAU 1745]|uniref:FGGY-family carbohydrate kinase n=1 Tax=Inquilinus sp. CAU 1745 TaxID=3140369 RepID=UPI00325C094B